MLGTDAIRRYWDLRDWLPELFGEPADATVRIPGPADTAAYSCPSGPIGVLVTDPHLVVVRDPVRLDGGRRDTYVRTFTPGNTPGVVILARIGDGFALVRHFRHATRRWHLELPRGFGTTGSTPQEDARRELHEELGAHATELHHLGAVYSDAGMHATPAHLFYADAVRCHVPDDDEGISHIEVHSPAKLGRLIGNGIDDGFTLAACARAAARGLLHLR
ncbi:NUDIX hydrolase [Micromonospora sp. PTRAS2]